MGEPAGIGGELTIRAWLARTRNSPVFAAVDDPDRLSAIATSLGVTLTVEVVENLSQAQPAFKDALPVLPCPLSEPVIAGNPVSTNADDVIRSIRQAVSLALDGEASGVVTNPIQKSVLAATGFKHPGHTEFLGELAGSGTRPVMMLAVEGLRVVPVTVHTPLSSVPALLTTEQIVHAGLTAAAGLRARFGIAAPRLAVTALNPHAGEDGLMGDEEAHIIRPAVNALSDQGLTVTGPHPADSLFHADARKSFDVAICMYHDQALIPLKALDFYGGVNVTLGLPFIRTSPDHGTALDIAGTGRADPSSFMAALHMAANMAAASTTS
jgi:4-hydroxythreonine-4-phosphate dehydrogenase